MNLIRILRDVAIALITLYLLRWFSLSGRVRIIGKTHKPLSFLGKRVNSLRYFPNIVFGLNPETNTLAGFRLNKRKYKPRREILIGTEGGEFAIDWFESDSVTLPDTAPIVFMCHGINGGSGEAFVQHFGLTCLHKFKYRPVCYIYRGCSGAKLTTPRSYNGGATEDIHIAIQEITKRFPKAKIALCGFSMGGNTLTKYLGEFKATHVQIAPPKHLTAGEKLHPNIICAAMSGCPFDYVVTSQTYTEAQKKSIGANYLLYFKKNEEQLKKQKGCAAFLAIDTPTADDFNEHLVADVFGYPSLRDLYVDTSSAFYVNGIDRPTLYISSANDPVSTTVAIPMRDISQNENTALLLTKSGGHMGQFYPFSFKRKFDEDMMFNFLASQFGGNGKKKD